MDPEFKALFIGTQRGLETKLVPKAGYNIEYIDIEGFSRRNMLKNVSVAKKTDYISCSMQKDNKRIQA